jgi:hypothetical protein
VPCARGNTGPICYDNGDGYVHDIEGGKSCFEKNAAGPTTCGTKPQPVPRSVRDCTPRPLVFDAAKKQTDPCNVSVACSFGNFASYLSFAVGILGPANPVTDLVSTGLGYVSAALYLAAGEKDVATQQMIATTIGIFAGSLGGRLAGAGASRRAAAAGADATRAATYGARAGGIVVGNAATAPFCGWTPGCGDMPGLTVYTSFPLEPSSWAPTPLYAPALLPY